ncbi:FimV/HubP family polar landmark protein [uncultured Thiodictyon sp.]|jgi:FimV-like protein|uniref:FimV/HubP family polar landmark protein n=1 Tax=uncultured Thiodictyon sp. TaxID=1846217 RepID=UPI0025EDABCE|nr:FimV/HubP family polar landmark protein [uncultured Thiodictyon sp.]
MRARARWIAIASLLPCCLGTAGAAEYGPVRSGETLWQVAGRVHPGGDLDRNQVMLALLRANPQAFTPSCNVNAALRVGVRLRVPTPEEIAAVDASAARQAIVDQGRDWAAHRRGGRPLDCAAPTEGASGTVASRPPPAADARPPPTPSKALPSGPAPATAAPCPCPAGAATGAAAGPVGFQGPPVAAGGEATPQVPPGPRASGWFLAVLALGLLAFAFLRSGGGRGAADAASREGTGGPNGPAALHLVPGSRNLYLLLLLAALAGISIRQSLVKGASSLCTVASGGSIGREGAMVQLAAMVASTLGRLARLPRDHLRLLVAAGAAAGLAAAYNAPLAATMLLLKVFATAVTLGSGGIGGAFTPTLFVGALQGALFGTLVQTVLPVGTAPPSAYAVVGMGAMLAATTQAPLMSILMIIEMTMDYQIVLPLMLAVVIAHYTALRYTGVRPMYAESLLPRPTARPPVRTADPTGAGP